MENAISKLLRKKLELVGAGRTDAGVHAKVMYAHFDYETEIDTIALEYRLNAFLPEDIAIHKIVRVKENAHARFDATSRTYEYWITKVKNPFLAASAHYIKQELDIVAMNKASELLLSHTDFQCFSKSNTDVHTYNCDVTRAVWCAEDEKMIFTITADRFLRNMVRAVVGTLLDVGKGKTTLKDVEAILASKDRSKAGASVPAKGLYLTKIEYPEIVYI